MKKWCLLLLLILSLGSSAIAKTEPSEEKWRGFDEAVIERIAEEKGKKPYGLFSLEGDLELFAFALLSGIAGLFVGYYWRKLISENRDASCFTKRTLSSSKGS